MAFILHRNTLTFRHPRASEADEVVFLRPFTTPVWYYLILFGGLAIFLLWLLTLIEKSFQVSTDDWKVSNSNLWQSNTRYSRINPSLNIWKIFLKQILKCKRYLKCHGFQWINQLIESFLFYVGVICQQGIPFIYMFFFFGLNKNLLISCID